ncbi:uncharacterized protein A4U43_C09F13880 [Asparagus officinalis]|uniref:Uncharacterized protein n=1 Tax=Asparagus officinalis TaxID=4686 RepID=A0A5P1EC70_ASPOF|nr:uncharacterized protein A4U43_C09F13880 [Asparagus officinalis]
MIEKLRLRQSKKVPEITRTARRAATADLYLNLASSRAPRRAAAAPPATEAAAEAESEGWLEESEEASPADPAAAAAAAEDDDVDQRAGLAELVVHRGENVEGGVDCLF